MMAATRFWALCFILGGAALSSASPGQAEPNLHTDRRAIKATVARLLSYESVRNLPNVFRAAETELRSRRGLQSTLDASRRIDLKTRGVCLTLGGAARSAVNGERQMLHAAFA